MENLPEELLNQIFCYVTDGDDGVARKTLTSVMLLSKALYHAARPLLYRKLLFDYGRGPFPFRQMLQLFMDRPGTAGFVRELELEECLPYERSELDGYDFGIKPISLDQSLQDRLVAATGAINVSPALRADIEAGVRAGNQDALLCLVLHFCENLTSLNLNSESFDGRTMTMRLAEEIVSGCCPSGNVKHHPLQRLDTCRLGRNSDTEWTNALADLLPFWMLPSLRHFEGGRIICDVDYSPSISVDAALNLRSLVFRDSLIGSTGLKDILISCPHLRDLVIEVGLTYEIMFTLDFHEFGLMLANHGTQLERMVLTTGDGMMDDDKTGHIPDLSRMTQLQALYLDWDALFGEDYEAVPDGICTNPLYLANKLPSRLQTLAIEMEFRDSAELQRLTDIQLLELMTNERFQRLGLIVITRRSDLTFLLPPGWTKTVFERKPRDCLWGCEDYGDFYNFPCGDKLCKLMRLERIWKMV